VRERWWLDDYALFEAISEAHSGASWREWPAPLRDRDPRALEEARRRLPRQVLSHQYRQWVAETQWQAARTAARANGVRITGDLPFVVDTHSADVWARQDEFLLDVSAGAPPDAFSATGQDWGLPTYRWDVIRAKGYPWIRLRAARMAALYDEFRVDHLIGFYRTYGRPKGGEPFFNPADEPTQVEQGEAVLRIFAASGARVIAEDLGVIPDFARASLGRLGIPGFKVLRWERAWQLPGQPFVDPADYPAASVAMTGTHDTETLAGWWDHASREERAALTSNAFFGSRGLANPEAPWQPALRDALLTLVYASASNDLFVPMQDVFGWRDRINVPATVSDTNWTWRLPWPADRLRDEPEAAERASFCRALAEATGRSRRST
jgi:4-alpha-glucanotransferase